MAHPGSVAIVALLAATLSAPADVYSDAAPSSPTKQSSSTKSMRHNLPDFGQATTTLYRGGQPTKEGFRMLAKMGVNIVVDLRGDRESERKLVTSLGTQYVPMYWFCWSPKNEVFAQFLTLLRKNSEKKFLCTAGSVTTAPE